MMTMVVESPSLQAQEKGQGVTYIEPSPLESATKGISNGMWKFMNGHRDQKLLTVKVSPKEAEILENVAYQRSEHQT